jgi:hypothetical protein
MPFGMLVADSGKISADVTSYVRKPAHYLAEKDLLAVGKRYCDKLKAF